MAKPRETTAKEMAEIQPERPKKCPEPEWPDSGRNGRNTAEAAGIAGQKPEWPNGLDRTAKRRPDNDE